MLFKKHFIQTFIMAVAISTPLISNVAAGSAGNSSGNGNFTKRCGWVFNPTPANIFLTDAEADWLIGLQGGYQAKGDVASFPDDDEFRKEINGPYGYSCQCLTVSTNKTRKRITAIKSAKAMPLATCFADKNLPQDPG